MSLLEHIKAFWRLLDECATDHDPVADLAERVARLERQAFGTTAAPDGPIVASQAAFPEQTGN